MGGYTVTSSPGGQVRAANPPAAGPLGDAAITVGEALEATAVVIGNKPVDQSDAAAIQAAEVRATGRGQVIPGGISAEAQAAANQNAQLVRDEDKTKMVDILKVHIHPSISYYLCKDFFFHFKIFIWDILNMFHVSDTSHL